MCTPLDPYSMNGAIGVLTSKGILLEDSSDGQLALDPQFQKAVESRSESFNGSAGDAVINEVDLQGMATSDLDRLETVLSEAPRMAGLFVELHPRLASFDLEQILHLTIVLENVIMDPAPSEGSPRAFLPIHADRLPTIFPVLQQAIVYIWLEDCDPCEQVVNAFNELFSQPPGNIALYAVYGPEDAELLEGKFDVSGGPTTLFVKNGTIETRLYGRQSKTVLDKEIKLLTKS